MEQSTPAGPSAVGPTTRTTRSAGVDSSSVNELDAVPGKLQGLHEQFNPDMFDPMIELMEDQVNHYDMNKEVQKKEGLTLYTDRRIWAEIRPPWAWMT